MATYWNGTTLAVSSAVAQALGSFTVPANSYFQGQVGVANGSTGVVIILVGGVPASFPINAGGATSTGNNNTTPIIAGPNQVISIQSVSFSGTAFLTGIVLVNSPNP
jgi:hypothetical protein